MMASIDDLLHDPVLEADLKRQQKQVVISWRSDVDLTVNFRSSSTTISVMH